METDISKREEIKRIAMKITLVEFDDRVQISFNFNIPLHCKNFWLKIDKPEDIDNINQNSGYLNWNYNRFIQKILICSFSQHKDFFIEISTNLTRRN